MENKILNTKDRNEKIVKIFNRMPEECMVSYLKLVPEMSKYIDPDNTYDEDIYIDYYSMYLCNIEPKYHKALHKLKIDNSNINGTINQKNMTFSYLAFSPKSDQDFDEILEKAINGDSILTYLCIFNAALHNKYTPGMINFFNNNFSEVKNIIARYSNDVGDIRVKKLCSNFFKNYILNLSLKI